MHKLFQNDLHTKFTQSFDNPFLTEGIVLLMGSTNAYILNEISFGHLLSKTLTWGNSELRKIANLDGFMSKLLPSSLDWLVPSHLIQNTHSNVFNSFQIPLASIKEIEMPLYQ